MATLAISTSGPRGGLALRPPAGPDRHVEIAAGRGRGRDMLPALRELLRIAGLGTGDLTRVAVDVGPGSFTGVRVGVTVGKTLAFALGLPARPLGSLDLLAWGTDAEDPRLAVRDAGRGTVYFKYWGPDAPTGRTGRAPGSELAALAAGALVLGDDAAWLRAQFGWTGDLRSVAFDAARLLDLACHAPGDEVPAHDLLPVYLQASAPERKAADERGA